MCRYFLLVPSNNRSAYLNQKFSLSRGQPAQSRAKTLPERPTTQHVYASCNPRQLLQFSAAAPLPLEQQAAPPPKIAPLSGFDPGRALAPRPAQNRALPTRSPLKPKSRSAHQNPPPLHLPPLHLPLAGKRRPSTPRQGPSAAPTPAGKRRPRESPLHLQASTECRPSANRKAGPLHQQSGAPPSVGKAAPLHQQKSGAPPVSAAWICKHAEG